RIYLFLDADTHLPARTLAAAWALRDRVVGAGALVRFPQTVPWMAGRLAALWNVCSRTMAWAAGCFLFVQREAFERVGGFDERLFAAEEIALSQALHPQGRFVILNEPVLTSDRKVQPGWFWRHLKLVFRVALTAGRGLESRKGLELWYDPKR
ncbi:MAG: hypothetical protein R3236_09605, partial [Phycisphaeraceae bacterium]|nr:hypothetical protein [Phycisphaeraceae bacterium]